MTTAPHTPGQTIGPFFHVAMPGEGADRVTDAGDAATIVLEGRVLDGEGRAVTDALVELWQADPGGRYPHPDDARSGECDGRFRGFARVATDGDGRFTASIVKPGRVAGARGGEQAPHVAVTVFATGLLHRLVTRMYFPDEPHANGTDEVLCAIEPARRERLVARPGEGRLRFDIHLQGDEETPFLDV